MPVQQSRSSRASKSSARNVSSSGKKRHFSFAGIFARDQTEHDDDDDDDEESKEIDPTIAELQNAIAGEEERDSIMPGNGIAHLDVTQMQRSLTYVRYSKKEKLPPILMYEINAQGESMYHNMTLRELLNVVNAEARLIDETFLQLDANREKDRSRSESSSPLFSALSPPRLSVSRPAAKEEKERGKHYDSVHELRLRDLRRLDFQFNPNEEKLILIRRHAVLFAMDPIRAVVMARRLILIVPDGADSLLSILDETLKEWLDATGRQSDVFSLAKASFSNNKENELLATVSPLYQRPSEQAKQAPSGVSVDGNSVTDNASNFTDLTAIPFEFHALEALLTTVKALESQEFTKLDQAVKETLSYFKSGSLLLPVKIQERMRQQKNELSMMASRINASKNALQELTEDDEEMALMNLTVLSQDPTLYRFPLVPEILGRHDEIEELLESYLVDFNTIEMKLNNVKSQVQSAEESVSLRLDTSRNDLLTASTAITMMSCSIAFGAYVAGLFGMNLDNTLTLQDRPNGFLIVAVSSFALVLVLFSTAFSYLRWRGILPARKIPPRLKAKNSKRPVQSAETVYS